MTTRSARTARLVAAAATLLLMVAATGQPADAKPPTRPGKVTRLAVDAVTKPAAAYRVATSWQGGSNTTSYRVAATDAAGAVLDSATVTTPAWVATVTGTTGATIQVTVTPYHDTRKGQASRIGTRLPDLTPPTGSFELAQAGRDVTLRQTALSDDASAAAGIRRVVDWKDGSPAETWSAGLAQIAHTYPLRGLWHPTVTLTDEAGNSAVLPLGAAVVGDDVAPTGAFTTGLGSAWAGFTPVALTQEWIDDEFSADADIRRTVHWGDGTDASWPTGAAAEHVYAAAGSYTPSVELVDEAGNSATYDATPVLVGLDELAPAVRVRVPQSHRQSVRSWRTLHGRATDAGTGVARVSVKVVEQRGSRWYGYRADSGTWRAAASKRAAWHRARAITVTTTPGTGTWQAALKHLRKGRLVVRAVGADHVGNVSAPVTRVGRLTRR